MVDISKVKSHNRITKTGIKTVKGYDRKKRLKKALAVVGGTGLLGAGLLLNRKRLGNVVNKLANKTKSTDINKESAIKLLTTPERKLIAAPKEEVVKVANRIIPLKGDSTKLLKPGKERIGNTTEAIKNGIINVGGKVETRSEKLARLFPTKGEAIKGYKSKRQLDKTYLNKANKELDLANKIEDKATTRADLDRADKKRIKATAQISRSNKRLEDMLDESPVKKAFNRSTTKSNRSSNTKLKVSGKGKPKKKL